MKLIRLSIIAIVCVLSFIQCVPEPGAALKEPQLIDCNAEAGETTAMLKALFNHTDNLKTTGFYIWMDSGNKTRKEAPLTGVALTAFFTGLIPDTEYSYSVFYGNGQEELVSESHSFRTKPEPEPGPEPEPEPEPQPLPQEIFDPALYRFLLKNFDSDNDGVFTTMEAERVTELNLENVVLDSLAGLETLANLESLSLMGTTLETIDVSRNKSLKFLAAGSDPYLKEIVMDNPNLVQTYFIEAANLKSLDISLCPEMYICEWWGIPLEGTVDFSKCPQLFALRFSGTHLTELDLSINKKLTHLNSVDNLDLEVIWLREVNHLETLEVDPHTRVEYK